MQPKTQTTSKVPSDAIEPSDGPVLAAPEPQTPSVNFKRKKVMETDSDNELGGCDEMLFASC